jgi:putative serine protease PepD
MKVNDTVIAIDGDTVNGADSLVGQIRARTPGTVVTLKVVRGGQTVSIQVTLGTKPATAN